MLDIFCYGGQRVSTEEAESWLRSEPCCDVPERGHQESPACRHSVDRIRLFRSLFVPLS
jgi:hypothetical protein